MGKSLSEHRILISCSKLNSRIIAIYLELSILGLPNVSHICIFCILYFCISCISIQLILYIITIGKHQLHVYYMQSHISSIGFLNITNRAMIKICCEETSGTYSNMDTKPQMIGKAIEYVTHMSLK